MRCKTRQAERRDPRAIIAAMTNAASPKRDSGTRVSQGWWPAAIAAALAIAFITTVRAVDDVALSIDSVAGDGWSAQGILVRFELPQDKALAHVSVSRLHLQSLSQELRDVRIDCRQVDLAADTISCKQARVLADWPGVGKQSLNASLAYGRRDGALDVSLDGLRFGQGTASVQGALRDGGWTAKARLNRVPVASLLRIAKGMKLPLPAVTADGLVTLSAHARGANALVHEAVVDATLIEVTANNESGSLASEKLSLAVQATLRRKKDLQFAVDIQSSQGQAYVQPIFADLTAHALSASAQGKWLDQGGLVLDRFTMKHAGVATASGSMRIDFDKEQPVRALQLELSALEFPGAYETYFQPLLLDTSFKSMQTAGRIAGRVSVDEGEPRSIELNLDDVAFDDGAGTLALTALRGQWHWRSEGDAEGDDDNESRRRTPAVDVPVSTLSWRDGSVLGLALGASDFRFQTSARQFRLLQPARIPVLDGSIDLETFRVRNAGTPNVAFLVDATVQPIGVRGLCKAFGWPEFGGRVGGTISKLRMREGVITLGTTLSAQVFDGNVAIRDLRLEQPFGQWPRFSSSIALDNLDLELVTGAFSFGRITGRLSGAIDGLQLFNWTPVAFDARLYTPEGDRSKHRISQRAVESIGSIGGGGAGVTAALSSGFLRFFDDFNYDRLGLSCRLENEVCVMSGAAPAPNGGYYLVKGKGLPRIDVIGSSRRVDWPRLVQQLIAATKSGGPVVN